VTILLIGGIYGKQKPADCAVLWHQVRPMLSNSREVTMPYYIIGAEDLANRLDFHDREHRSIPVRDGSLLPGLQFRERSELTRRISLEAHMNATITGISEGLRILIIEDEPLLALMLEDMLEGLAHRVAGSCATLEDAMETLAGGGFDAVLLDLDLRGKSGLPVAKQLYSKAIPFAIASGFPSLSDDEVLLGDVLILEKPFAFGGLEKVLDEFEARVANSPVRDR
jgi:CheY-like chemotaxis protein